VQAHPIPAVTPPQANFCKQCGASIETGTPACPRCGASFRETQQNLVEKLLTAIQEPIWKRRLLWIGALGVLGLTAVCAALIFFLFKDVFGFVQKEAVATVIGSVQDQVQVTLTADLPVDLDLDLPEALPTIDLEIDLPEESPPLEVPGLGIEIPHLTDEEEIEIGREAAAEFESQNSISSDPNLVEQVVRIGSSIVPYQPRSHIPYTFKVIDSTEINAFALPGGFIYISRGMLEFVRSDDELAGVIGHEIAHVALRHSAKQIEAIVTSQIALEVVLSGNSELETIYQDQSVQIATEMVAMIALRGWGRMNELDADEHGTVYMAHAGYDPRAVLDLMNRFADQEGAAGGAALEDLLATHPPFHERIERVENAIDEYELR
jgi:hypothetical protein